MYIMITGPEKTGKTTLAHAIARESRHIGVDAVHISSRYHPRLDPGVYLAGLTLGFRDDMLVIADRGWPDELVYAAYFDRYSPIKSAENYERYLGEVGFGVTLAPPQRLGDLDEDDWRIPYDQERQLFIDLTQPWGYLLFTEWDVSRLAKQLVVQVHEKWQQQKPRRSRRSFLLT
jgi:hypothetical protein